MKWKTFELIENLIRDKIIELNLSAKNHRGELRNQINTKIKEYVKAQEELDRMVN